MSSNISDLPPPPTSGDVPPMESKSASTIADLPSPPITRQAASGVSDLPPPPPNAGYDKLREESTRGIMDSVAQSPLLKNKPITPEELQTIADKHKVSVESLRNWLPWLSGTPQVSGDTSTGRIALDAMGESGGMLSQMAVGIPQKIAKKVAGAVYDEPGMQAALDDIQELAQARKSLVQTGAELVDVLPGLKAAKFLPKLTTTAGMGAATGYSSSRDENELIGATAGAALGSTLATTVHGVQKLFQKRAAAKAAKIEERVDRIVQGGGIDIQDAVQRRVEGAAAADRLIRDRVFQDKAIGDEGRKVIAEAYSPDSLAKRTDSTTEEYAATLEKVLDAHPSITQEALPAAIRQQAINDIANKEINSQIGKLATNAGISVETDGIAALRQWAGQGKGSGQGTEWAEETMRRMQRTNHSVQEIGSRGFRVTGDSTTNRLADWLSDAQYVLRSYSERYKGVGLIEAHQDVNTGLNKMSFARESFKAKMRDIYRLAKEQGFDETALIGKNVIEKIEDPERWAILTPDELKAAKAFSDFWEQQLIELNKVAVKDGMAPLAIKPRLGPNGERIYVPSQLMDGLQLQDTMAGRIAAFLKSASNITGNRYEDLAQVPGDVYTKIVDSDKDHNETMRFLGTLSKTRSKDPTVLSVAFKDTFLNRGGHAKLDTVARAALERDDVIPMWARETNLYKLADKWGTNTLRHVYLRRGIDKLQSGAEMLRAMGAEREAGYVDRLLTDISGIRKGTVAEATRTVQQNFMHKMDKWARSAAEQDKPTAEAVAKALKAIPIVLQESVKQVYPNFLGANPRSLIMNMTQTFTKTMPEFGTTYGASLAFRGAMYMVRGGVVKGFKAAREQLEREGLMPAKFVAAGEPYLAEGFARSAGVQAVGSAMRKLADVSMWPYGKAEEANRAIAWGMSKMMVHDLLSNSRHAMDTLHKFPTEIQQAIKAAGKDTTELQRIIGTHIINSTQYQYNRASMSEMGRTLGPLFSSFSKWPSATLGQVMESYRSQGAKEASKRMGLALVAPWVMLEMADQVMQASMGESTDRRNKLLSKSGLSQAAPVGNLRGYLPEGSLWGFGTGDFWSPPVIDTAFKMFAAGKGASSSTIGKGLDNAIYAFAPGGTGGWIRFITDDLVTLYTGQRPEGSTFIDRTKSGIDMWDREF